MRLLHSAILGFCTARWSPDSGTDYLAAGPLEGVRGSCRTSDLGSQVPELSTTLNASEQSQAQCERSVNTDGEGRHR